MPTTYGNDIVYCLKSHCGVRDIVGRSGCFKFKLSANSVMRGRVNAIRTFKGLVADLREYSNKLWFYQDSIGKTDRNKALIEMQEKYDQQKIINENNLSQIKKDRTIRNVLIALIILSFIIAITNYLYQRKIVSQNKRYRRKKKKFVISL